MRADAMTRIATTVPSCKTCGHSRAFHALTEQGDPVCSRCMDEAGKVAGPWEQGDPAFHAYEVPQ